MHKVQEACAGTKFLLSGLRECLHDLVSMSQEALVDQLCIELCGFIAWSSRDWMCQRMHIVQGSKSTNLQRAILDVFLDGAYSDAYSMGDQSMLNENRLSRW